MSQGAHTAAAALALVPVRVEDWMLFREGETYWIKDVDLAERSGLTQPRSIRRVIETCIADGLIQEATIGGSSDPANPAALFRTVEELTVSGKGRTQSTTVYYLNREAAVHVVVRLRTPKAIELQVAVVRVFVLATEGKRPAVPPPPVDRRLAGFLLLLSHATEAGDVGAIGRIVDMGRSIGVPGLPPPEGKPLEPDLETLEEVRARVFAYVQAANARGVGPRMQDVEAGVPATLARTRRAVHQLLAAKRLEDRGKYHVMSLWALEAAPAPSPPAPRANAKPGKGKAPRRGAGRAHRAPPPKPTPPDAGPSNADLVFDALTKQGFKRREARRAVAALGDRVKTEPLADLVRDALAQLG